MLLLLVTGLLIGSLLVLGVKKNRESLLLAGMCLSLTLYLLGLMILIAKKSGISYELELFLFFSRDIRTWIQYRFITLGSSAISLPSAAISSLYACWRWPCSTP